MGLGSAIIKSSDGFIMSEIQVNEPQSLLERFQPIDWRIENSFPMLLFFLLSADN